MGKVMLIIEKKNYKGWANSYYLTNNRVDLVVVTDVGPRVIRFGFVDGQNLFFEDTKTLGVTGGDEWQLYGGHRLWHAPEAVPRTYYPDNQPVQASIEAESLVLRQDVESTTGIKKEILISLDPRAPQVEIVHRLVNHNTWPIQVAPWALSVMAPGGRAIVPLPPRGSHPENLLPTSSIALWAYTHMADARWTWGNQFVFLDQDIHSPAPQKAGFYVVDGWVAYQRGKDLLVKLFDYHPAAQYPDRNSNVELFTNHQMLEVETLGGLVTLAPGEDVAHKETWLLFSDLDPIDSEADAQRIPGLRYA